MKGEKEIATIVNFEFEERITKGRSGKVLIYSSGTFKTAEANEPLVDNYDILFHNGLKAEIGVHRIKNGVAKFFFSTPLEPYTKYIDPR